MEKILQAPQFYRENKLLVLDETMATKNRQFLPVFFTENVVSENREILTVVVPGSVSQGRRDYLHIFEKIKDFKNPTRLVLLGKANGRELAWIKNLEKIKPQHIDLVYFKEKVQPQEFIAWMKDADVLWCPVLEKTKFFSIQEYYGKTKMTGNLGDAINYGKIAVFPKNYASHYSFIKLESNNIESQLISLKHAENMDFFKNFDIMTIEKKLQSTLNNLI